MKRSLSAVLLAVLAACSSTSRSPAGADKAPPPEIRIDGWSAPANDHSMLLKVHSRRKLPAHRYIAWTPRLGNSEIIMHVWSDGGTLRRTYRRSLSDIELADLTRAANHAEVRLALDGWQPPAGDERPSFTLRLLVAPGDRPADHLATASWSQ